MTILLLAEHDNKALSEQTAKVLSAATKIGGDVHVLVAGSGASAVAEAAAKLSGVAKVLVADDAAYAHGLSEPLTDLIVSQAGGYDVVIGAATSVAKSVLPRVADFRPDLILISAGFDAHHRDPLAQINLVADDFDWATGRLMELSEKSANNRVVSLLEGGYDLQGLAESAATHIYRLMRG